MSDTCINCQWFGVAETASDEYEAKPKDWSTSRDGVWIPRLKRMETPVCRVNPPVPAMTGGMDDGDAAAGIWPTINPYKDWCSRLTRREEASTRSSDA